MKTKVKWIILLAVLIAVIGAAAFAYQKLGGYTSADLMTAQPQSSDASDNMESTENSENGENAADAAEPEKIPAPDFSLEDAEGNQLSFLDLIGDRPIVLNFWASTCPPCKQEMPDFQAAYETYGEDILFVMLNVGDAMQGETREKAEQYLLDEAYTFPVYYDMEYSGISAFGIRGFPSTFFLDAEGNVIAGAASMISAETLELGLSMIAPELFPEEPAE